MTFVYINQKIFNFTLMRTKIVDYLSLIIIIIIIIIITTIIRIRIIIIMLAFIRNIYPIVSYVKSLNRKYIIEYFAHFESLSMS